MSSKIRSGLKFRPVWLSFGSIVLFKLFAKLFRTWSRIDATPAPTTGVVTGALIRVSDEAIDAIETHEHATLN